MKRAVQTAIKPEEKLRALIALGEMSLTRMEKSLIDKIEQLSFAFKD